MTFRKLATSGLVALVARVSAQVANISPATDIQFKLNIPENTASTGNGDIFFAISAPSSYAWAALGQGNSMGGSNMFVVYTSSSGSNVTVSPRTTSGHNTPTVNTNTKVTLLEGSGVSNGVMTANIKCSNCNSWTGGTMDFAKSSGNWIYAYQPSGGPINSDDQSAAIKQHSDQGAFKWDFAKAKGGSSVNPFLAASSSNSGTSGTVASTCIPRPASASSAVSSGASSTQPVDGSDSSKDGRPSTRSSGGRPPARRQDLPYCDEGSSGGDRSNSNQNNGFTAISSAGSGNQKTMLIAHGVLASLAFVILFPTGAIAIRLASFPGLVWVHAAFQGLAYLVYIAGFGLGVYMAKNLRLLDHYHPIIGMVVLVLVSTQAVSGWVHHRQFKKQPGRTPWSHAHLWVGRIAVTLGIINGGLGLKLADRMRMSSHGGMVAYGVVAGLVWVVWVAAMVVGERRRARTRATAKYAQRLSDPHATKP